jgi:hypothetical protein
MDYYLDIDNVHDALATAVVAGGGCVDPIQTAWVK